MLIVMTSKFQHAIVTNVANLDHKNSLYINYYEFFQLTQHAKLVNNILIIYTELDFQNIFHNALHLFTETYLASAIYSGEPELIPIAQQEKFALINTIYFTFVNPYNPLFAPHPTPITITNYLLQKHHHS